MEELDKLKKNWNAAIHPKVSAESIYKMILKKSSSAVKWIFIICTIELALGLISGIILISNPKNELNLPSWFETIITIAGILIPVIYSYKFFKNYQKINTTSSVKELLNNIIKTRTTVKQFVLINLSLISVMIAFVSYYTLTMPIGLNNEIAYPLITIKDYFVLALVILILTTVVIGICLFVYFLLYGIVMRKLNKNYKELKQLDL